jgi:hypothetical protein
MSSNIPESWIDEDVVVLVGESSEPFEGTLLQINERGVAIRHPRDHEGIEEREDLNEGVKALLRSIQNDLVFFPWPQVRLISRAEKPEQE